MGLSASNINPKHKRQAAVKNIKHIRFKHISFKHITILHITFLHEQGHTRMHDCTIHRSRYVAARAVGAIWCEQML